MRTYVYIYIDDVTSENAWTRPSRHEKSSQRPYKWRLFLQKLFLYLLWTFQNLLVFPLFRRANFQRCEGSSTWLEFPRSFSFQPSSRLFLSQTKCRFFCSGTRRKFHHFKKWYSYCITTTIIPFVISSNRNISLARRLGHSLECKIFKMWR